ncbi:MAG: riboflavin biosynthesis protein RibF [Bacteroidales bacterium]|nr:riboflavin biosynthesis protein RibF [Bacteroidales bacterium]
MKIYYDFEHLEEIRNAVVTTGSFDGVHSGHKAILERLKKLAFEIGGETVLITFQPHPRKVLYPDTYGKDLRLITSPREKIELLSRAGLDHLILINFTKEFSKISSVSFVRDILLKKLHARKIITGYNHHFGHNREGDTELMRQLAKQFGFDVEEIPEQEVQQESVSSVTIRKALLEGDIQRANKYLDHNYIITGKCTSLKPPSPASQHPRYSIQLEEETKLLPPDGTYPVIIIDEEDKYPGCCFIRNTPESPIQASISFETFEPVHSLTGITTLLFQDKAPEPYAH